MAESHMLDDNWSDRERIKHMWDAIEAVDIAWSSWVDATHPIVAAHALADLAERFSDLRSWHPSYDADDGLLDWERDEEEGGG